MLKAFAAIDEDTAEALTSVKVIRRRYLHFYSQELGSVDADSIACYQAAVAVVTKLIGQDVRDGRIVLNPAFAKYMGRQGLISDE